MKWKMLTLSALFVAFPIVSNSHGSCPSVCACKWKGGKQTVECLERALITVPENIDSETQVLDMSGNNLQIIPRETFYRANLTNLQKVFLKSCRIGQIGERAFRGLTNLVQLDLSNNLLTTVPSATFEDTPFLRNLSLANNPIQKIESDAFKTVMGMAKIDLSHCEIQIISPNAFEKLESLEWLKLNGNKLTQLHPKTIETIRGLHGIELHDNPWLCDCKLRSVKELLSHNGMPYSVAPTCSRPERLFGRSFAELSVDDFACRPEILPVSRYIEAATGENATVICRVGAVPSANVHWYWNGRLLLNNSAFSAFQKIFIFEKGKFDKTSSLILTNALNIDSGEFFCVAENRAGTAEANFTLIVSLTTASKSPLGSGQIAGMSAALVILILAILLIALVLLLRLRRLPFFKSEIAGQLEVIAKLNDNGTTMATKTAPKNPTNRQGQNECQSANPVDQPLRRSDYLTISLGRCNSSRSNSLHPPSQLPAVNDPDILCDAKMDGSNIVASDCFKAEVVESKTLKRLAISDSLHKSPALACDFAPSKFLLVPGNNYSVQCRYDASDGALIVRKGENSRFYRANPNEYPSDYGLPILRHEIEYFEMIPALDKNPFSRQVNCENLDSKTLRICQEGIPAFPKDTALVKPLKNSRNSPDEGYQEGCGTDV